MGFLKFLKRDKKDSLDELDLPPEPPPLEGFEENMPADFPDFNENLSADMPKFDFEKADLGKEDNMGFPELPEMEEKEAEIPPFNGISYPEPMPTMPQMPQPMQPLPEPEPKDDEMHSDNFPRMERRLFSQEKRMLRERPSAKTIYVRIDKFKATLGSINMVRSDLRKSEEALMKLENIKNSKDRSFDKVKVSLDDLQKKLIFVDKILFKGE